jgi:hypothetical protein
LKHAASAVSVLPGEPGHFRGELTVSATASNIDSLVRLIRTGFEHYQGGERFFSALDASLTHHTFTELLLHWTGQMHPNIVVSGRFGQCFAARYGELFDNLITARGNLRLRWSRVDLSHLANRIRNRQFVFFDDSYYSGTTRNKLANEIERLGGKLVETRVLYDGSPIRDSSVFGIVRYHS